MLRSEEITLKPEEVDTIHESVQSLLAWVRNEADNHMKPFSPSICTVPRVLRELSPKCFSPQVVAIGPLHKEDWNVQTFEGQKASYLVNLMSRINSPEEEIMRSCMKKAYTSMNKIKECYVWTKTYGDDEIAKMMVVDACFILEFIYQISESEESYVGNMVLAQTVMYDLVLLENQIPFFFLEKIFQSTILKLNPDTSLVKFIHPIISFLNLFETKLKIRSISNRTPDHILGLLHQCYKPHYRIKSDISNPRIHSAVDLDKAGVNFKPNQDQTWVMAMEVKSYRFLCLPRSWSKPTLAMPVFNISDFTELVLRNLIAYEQQSSQTHKYITSYAYAMDMLVKTQEDVAKLVDSRVLINNMGTNEEVAKMINNLCKEVASRDFFYVKEWKTLSNYWQSDIAWLRRTYFTSPWNIISLLAGIVLFFLTVIQTIFTINPVGSNK